MEILAAKLLNDFQRDFPLSPRPFAQIARSLKTNTKTVLAMLKDLQEKGVVSRVGPVFRVNTVGASTLAAIAVVPEDLARIASLVSGFPQVNHNYEREHRYNLWFVVTAADRPALRQTLQEIRETTGHAVLSLPLLCDYHIDLGFRMAFNESPASMEFVRHPGADNPDPTHENRLGSAEDLIEVIQDGLPLASRPYQEIGARLGWPEQTVINEMRDMIEAGIIKRLGVVVRHHELGYRANAMVVWDAPDDRVDQLGRQLGREDRVTLCYQRPRRLPEWPYNLFCMVHGRGRGEVRTCIERMTVKLGLEHIPREVLFSGRRFKQRGARYRLGH